MEWTSLKRYKSTRCMQYHAARCMQYHAAVCRLSWQPACKGTMTRHLPLSPHVYGSVTAQCAPGFPTGRVCCCFCFCLSCLFIFNKRKRQRSGVGWVGVWKGSGKRFDPHQWTQQTGQETRDLNSTQRNTGNVKAESRIDDLPHGRAHQLAIQCQSWSLKVSTQVTLYGLNRL